MVINLKVRVGQFGPSPGHLFNDVGVGGRASAAAEAPLTVAGLHPDADAADWVIARAVHTVDGQGFRTDLEAEVKP